MPTLLAASGGGHLSELVRLVPRLPFDPGETVWFTEDSPQSRSLLAGEQVVHADPAPPRDWAAALRNRRLAGALLRHFDIDAALSTGASIAVSALPLASRHGATAWYVESAARLEGPSMSGRILAAVPGVRTVCQYPAWAAGRWSYAGSVFDGFAAGPARPHPELRRIVVTVGSQDGFPFDRLIARLARIVPDDAQVLWQTGATDPRPHGVPGVRSVPAAELERAMAEADVVVAHAGVGSALAALSAGAHPVLVPRRLARGEHVDDHQEQVADELTRRGLATSCTPEQLDLEVLLDAARRRVVAATAAPPLVLDA